MLLQIKIDSLTNKQISDLVSEKFWTHPNFWIEISLATIGILIGWFAYKEAHKAFTEAGKAKDAATAAKEAAIKAGKTVKKQSILLAISETIRLCQIRGNTNYEDSNNKLMEILGKVRNIIGLYREDLGQIHQNLLQQIEVCTSDALTEFNLLDPEAENKTIYNKIRPVITILAGHLNELQGVLENELIENN
jgi:hypothetical protein